MFWGVTILSGRRYTQTVEKSYHISKAALEIPVDGKNPNKRVQLMLEQNKTHYLLCNLDTDKIVQVDLDLIFTEGEEVTFYLNGDGVVHLSGYVLDFDDGDDFDDFDEEGVSDEESEDEEVTNDNAKRVLKAADSASAKKAKVESAAKVAVNGGLAVDEDDDDDLGQLDLESDDDEEDEEDDEEEDEEDDDVPQQKPVQKQINGQAGKAKPQQKGTPAKQNQPQQAAKNIGSAGKPNQTPKGGQQNQNNNKSAQKGQNTVSPQGQKQPNANQKGGPQQKGQLGQQNKQPFNKQKGPFTPDQKASQGNFNKFNKNKGRKSFN